MQDMLHASTHASTHARQFCENVRLLIFSLTLDVLSNKRKMKRIVVNSILLLRTCIEVEDRIVLNSFSLINYRLKFGTFLL